MYETRAFIHEWEMKCWKCKRWTPVLYALRPPNQHKEENFDPSWIGNYEVNPDRDTAMGEALASKYGWYKLGLSKTIGEEVYASWCVLCNVLQGNWYVWKEWIHITNDPSKIPEITEYIDYETDFNPDEYGDGDEDISWSGNAPWRK